MDALLDDYVKACIDYYLLHCGESQECYDLGKFAEGKAYYDHECNRKYFNDIADPKDYD